MIFDEWWIKIRSDIGNVYATLGRFSIRAIAKLAWDAAQLQNTCGTCRHWHNRSQDLGICDKISTAFDGPAVLCEKILRRSTGDHAWVDTIADFGCVLWEEKDVDS